MCEISLGRGLAAAILGAIGFLLFFNGFWLQYSWAGRQGTSTDLVLLFVQYVVALVFLCAAKVVLHKGKKEAGRKR